MDSDNYNSTHQEKGSTIGAHRRIKRPIPPSSPHAFWFAIFSLFAGPLPAAPLLGATLWRGGRQLLGILCSIFFAVAGLTFLIFIFFLQKEWFWQASTLIVVHILCSVILYFLFRLAGQRPEPQNRERGTYRHVVVGAIGGGFFGVLAGSIITILFLLFLDQLFSTFVPVTFEDQFAFAIFSSEIFFLALAGALAGGLLGRFRPELTPKQMVFSALVIFWVQITLLAAMEITIALPGFQARAATGEGWKAIFSTFMTGNFLLGFWWPSFLLFYVISPKSILIRCSRVIQVVGINLVIALVFAILLGYSDDAFLALGRTFERQGQTMLALDSYKRGLNKEPDDNIAAYLQYRVALLDHKLGNDSKAREGFQRVVAKYNASEELTMKASRFLDNLERSRKGKRVVLKGVETPTEYKGGYCVPNSLALAMRFWGYDVTARDIGERITGLGSGTFVVNQSWYAEQAGFRHDFLPLASIEDIKTCIDAGFPVLVYVPAHIFAIVGYDDALETFVTYDVATNDIWEEYLREDFIKSWKRQATTLVLTYPPEKEDCLPPTIHERLVRLSDNYLQFQLHYFDAPGDSVSLPHLWKGAGDTGEFFFPVTILYADYAGLRPELDSRYSPDHIAKSIITYFQNDYDEGTHLWGQKHEKGWADPDWALQYSMQYLIGQQRFDLLLELVKRIDAEGAVSDTVLADAGMINLADGNLGTGLDQLRQVTKKKPEMAFYAGLAYLELGDRQGAVRSLVEAINGFG